MENTIKKIFFSVGILCFLLFSFSASYFLWNSAQNQKTQKERTQQIFDYYEKQDREKRKKQQEEESAKTLSQAKIQNQERYTRCLDKSDSIFSEKHSDIFFQQDTNLLDCTDATSQAEFLEKNNQNFASRQSHCANLFGTPAYNEKCSGNWGAGNPIDLQVIIDLCAKKTRDEKCAQKKEDDDNDISFFGF